MYRYMVKLSLKKIIMLSIVILMAPVTLSYFFLRLAVNENDLIKAYGQTLCCLPGKWGSYLRAGFFSSIKKNISQDIYIGFGSYFSHPDIIIASGVYIGAYTIIGRAEIGRDCDIGSNVQILSGNKQHVYSADVTSTKQQTGVLKKIYVGQGCWIGNSAVVMADLAENCVIGAGAVVPKKTVEDGIYIGNPAKLIKYTHGKTI